MTFYSQSAQDKWVADVLKNKRDGFFLDIGAHDGYQNSNTYCFEESLGWKGICVEANPHVFSSLARNRKSINLNLALMDYKGEVQFGTDTVGTPPYQIVKCDTLENILIENKAPKEIDYLSIDVEGCEYAIFKNFPFENWDIVLMTVEHNSYIHGPEKKDKLFNLLSSKGFHRAVNDAPCLDTNPVCFNLPYEDWYINNKYLHLIT